MPTGAARHRSHDSPDREPPEQRPAAVEIPADPRGAALTVLAVLAVVLVLKFAEAVVIPIVLGVLISYALDPIVHAMVRLRLPRPIAAALLLIALTAGAGWLGYSLRAQVTDIVEQLPKAAHRLRQRMESHRTPSGSPIRQVQQAANELEKAADAAAPPPTRSGVQRVQVETPPFDVANYLMSGSIGVATAVGQAVVILFLVYFRLASGDLYRHKLLNPYVGPVVVTGGTTAVVFLQFDSIRMALLIGGVSLAITSIEG